MQLQDRSCVLHATTGCIALHPAFTDAYGRSRANLGPEGQKVGNRGLPKLGVPFWGSNSKDYSILGSPYVGKLPNSLQLTLLTPDWEHKVQPIEKAPLKRAGYGVAHWKLADSEVWWV